MVMLQIFDLAQHHPDPLMNLCLLKPKIFGLDCDGRFSAQFGHDYSLLVAHFVWRDMLEATVRLHDAINM